MTKQNKRQLAKAKTRAKILQTARKLWAEPGSFNTVTIRDIANGAGMSTGAIFANWSGKEALWLDVMGYPAPSDCEAVRAVLQAMCAPVVQEAA